MCDGAVRVRDESWNDESGYRIKIPYLPTYQVLLLTTTSNQNHRQFCFPQPRGKKTPTTKLVDRYLEFTIKIYYKVLTMSYVLPAR